MDRLFGGNPLAVLLRLALISIVVGVVLSALGVRPQDLFTDLARIFRRLWEMGFDVFRWAWYYLLLGAAVVIPVWLGIRLLSLGRSNKAGGPPTGPRA
jgi:hypothetical protein